MLLLARLLKLGFIGDFLSTSVLVDFLTGVGIQVLSGQIPDMLGVPKGTGNWFAQQWSTITSIPDASLATVGFAVLTVGLIIGFDKFLPKIPDEAMPVRDGIVGTFSCQGHDRAGRAIPRQRVRRWSNQLLSKSARSISDVACRVGVLKYSG